MKHVTVTERLQFNKSPIDREKCIISGVKLLGWESRNGATYDKVVFTRKASQYDGALSNINHGTKTVEGRFGRVIGPIEAREDGLYGNIRYNPKLPLTESILWNIENDPGAIGMSHDAVVKMEMVNGRKTYTDLVKVNSVDIVSDPATTRGVFESMNPDGTPATSGEQTQGSPEDAFKAQIGEILASGAASLPHDKFKEIVKHMVAAHGCLGDSEKAAEALKENAELKAKLDAYAVKEQLATKLETAKQICKRLQLPAVAVTEHFLNVLVTRKDEKEMEADVLDRKKTIGVREAVTDNKPNAPAADGVQTRTLEQFVKFCNTGAF